MGRNLALPNSFFLNFTNNSSSEFTFYLFNQGGALQTPITNQQNLSSITNYDLGSFIDANGNVLVSTAFSLQDSVGAIFANTILTTGQNISLLNTIWSSVTGTNGLTGSFSIVRLASPLVKFVNVAVGSANAYTLKIIGGTTIGIPFSLQTTSFVTTNPLVSVGGTIPYTDIQNSQTGNSYKIMGMDVYSNQSNQLLQDINYGMKDVNGDRWIVGENPIIDPYQPSIASIQSVDTQGFTIDSETLFYYVVEAYTFVRLSFNYVRAELSIMKAFDQAFIQQLTMESEKMKRALNLGDRERYILYQ